MSTGCILGFASSEWKAGSGEWYDTHIGGVGVWPEDLRVPIPVCPLCRRHRTLVLQAYAPHSAHSQREIYLYGCNSIQCSGQAESWYPVRLVKRDEAKNYGGKSSASCIPSKGLRHATECKIINWDSDSSSDASESGPDSLLKELEELSLALKQHDEGEKVDIRSKHLERKTTASTSPRRDIRSEHFSQLDSIPFPSFYVEVENEPGPEQCDEEEEQVNRLLSKYQEEEKLRSKNGISEQWAPEPDEQEKPEVISLQKFNERIARAPEQIIRYDFGAEPLWPRHPPPVIRTKTCECGAPMIFELQLLASCIHYLRPEDALPPEEKEAGMNFASVAIYTCANDCEETEAIIENTSFKGFEQEICVQRDDW